LQLPARTEQTANQSAKRESPSHTKKNRPLSGRIPYAKTAAAAAGDELEKNLHIFFQQRAAASVPVPVVCREAKASLSLF